MLFLLPYQEPKHVFFDTVSMIQKGIRGRGAFELIQYVLTSYSVIYILCVFVKSCSKTLYIKPHELCYFDNVRLLNRSGLVHFSRSLINAIRFSNLSNSSLQLIIIVQCALKIAFFKRDTNWLHLSIISSNIPQLLFKGR